MKKLGLVTALLSLGTTAYALSGNFTVGGDWLYWKAYQENMQYAAHLHITSEPSSFDVHPELIEPNFQPRSGFRVFAEYECSSPCSPWYVGAIFTRHYTKTHQHDAVDPELFPSQEGIALNSPAFSLFLAFNENGGVLSSLDSIWKNSFNYFDLDFAYDFCYASCFELSPHLGLRGMWVRQNLALGGIGLVGDDGALISSQLNERVNGYGLEGGVWGLLQLGCGFSLVGHFGGSLLYSGIRVNENFMFFNLETEGTTTIRVSDNHHQLIPTVEGFLGLQWGREWCCHPVELHIGWEQHYIFNLNHFAIFNNTSLSLQGLTLGGSVGF